MPSFLARWLRLLVVCAISWGWFVANLFRFPGTEGQLAGSGLLLLAVSSLGLWRYNMVTRVLAWLPWGPTAPFLAWLSRAPWEAPVLTLLAMVFSVLHAALAPGASRNEMEFRNKLQQVRSGRLSYVREWGWVDECHQFLDLYDEVRSGRPFNRKRVIIFGTFRRCYELEISGRAGSDEEAMRIGELVAERCEDEQERLPFWMGSRVSAHNIDDLPSLYFTVFQKVHPELVFHAEPREQATHRWLSEGRGLVAQSVRGFADFRPADPSLLSDYQGLFHRLGSRKVNLQMQVVGPRPF